MSKTDNKLSAENLQQEIKSLGYEVFKVIRNIEIQENEIRKMQQEVSKKSAEIAEKENQLNGLLRPE